MEKGAIEDRNKHLNTFCKQIAELPHLHYTGIRPNLFYLNSHFLDVYQIFLRTKMVDLDPVEICS